MSLVLDASIALAWALGEEPGEASARAADAVRGGRVHVPSIWPLEVANGLLMQVRRRRIGWPDCAAALRVVADLQVVVEALDSALACGPIAALGQALGVTAYDAAYIELALRLEVPLATLDQQLGRAATAAGARLH